MLEKWLGLKQKTNLQTKEEARVLCLCGSLRKDSLNKKLLLEAMTMAENLNVPADFFDFKEHPIALYDGDVEVESGQPAHAKLLKEKMLKMRLIIIASCEHNASISAALKNAIDWASRGSDGKPSREAFKDRLFLLMGASPGKSGAARGLLHLRAILENNGAIVIEDQFSLPDALEAFDEKDQLKSESLKNKLQATVQTALNRAKLI